MDDLNVNDLAGDCKIIAQDMAPKFSGNLAFNSIRIQKLNDGFKIVYVFHIAPYVVWQQQGTRSQRKNRGFIDRTSAAIAAYVTGKKTGNINNINATKERVATFAKDNPLRQQVLLNSLNQTVRKK